jgi:hypothetical protein
MTIFIIPDETLPAFTHPALDLATGELIELAAEPAPVQLELFGAQSSRHLATVRLVCTAGCPITCALSDTLLQ